MDLPTLAPETRAARRRIAPVRSSRNSGSLIEAAPGVDYLTVGFVNLYTLGDVEQGWILVDTGLPGTAAYTRSAIARRRGGRARPEAIVLTHGHFDHAGAALALAEEWDVPVYAHRLELPYLTGRSDYPPQDPSMGGAIAQMSRVFPHSGFDLGSRVQPLPEDGSVPHAPGWRWLHTPGHTHGHVSLFCEADRILLAGDALATMDLDSWTSHLTEREELDRPAAPFTTDWGAARRSVEEHARLEPSVVAAGHGVPMSGPGVAEALHGLAVRFPVPPRGRYVGHPVRADESGVTEVPPPVSDPVPLRLAGAAAITGAALVLARRRR